MTDITMKSNLPEWSKLLEQAVTVPGKVAECYSRFHDYSIGNQLLAMWQLRSREIPLGPIASYKRWQQLGRWVKKGEKAITLCLPLTRTWKSKEPDGTEKTHRVLNGFTYKNNWFALAQTDGKSYQPEPLPTWNESQALEALGITSKPWDLLDGNCQGYASGTEVSINPLADHRHRTMMHELAHIVLGHTKENSVSFGDTSDRTPRDIRELEAECTSYIVSEALGLPGSEEARGYIQHWYRANTVPEKSAMKIFAAADKILKAGTGKAQAPGTSGTEAPDNPGTQALVGTGTGTLPIAA